MKKAAFDKNRDAERREQNLMCIKIRRELSTFSLLVSPSSSSLSTCYHHLLCNLFTHNISISFAVLIKNENSSACHSRRLFRTVISL